LYKVLSLNKFPIYTIKHEFGINSRKVSKVEYEWSCFMDHVYPEKEFMSAFNNRIGQKYFKEAVPDLYSPVTQEAYFFNGCIFYGHYDKCLINPKATEDSKNPFGKSFKDLNNEFEAKMNNLMNNNPTKINIQTTIWECQYKEMKKNSSKLQIFLKNSFLPHPLYRLKPRECVRGSYFDVFALCWSQNKSPNEKMYFVDINGLYSYCAIKFPYMVGKYKVVMGRDLNLLTINNNKFLWENKPITGAILLTILPPKNLFSPFLLYRTKNQKTVNTLCAKCADLLIQKCTHNDEQRAITGSYMITEIEFALSLNYKIIAIHECHVYEENDFILRDFIKILNFYKTKHSSFPAGQKSTKLEYLSTLNKELELTDPFLLTPSNIKPCQKKRNFFKLMANSIFGKLEEKHNKHKTIFVNSQADLESIYYSDNVIQDLFCVNDEICEVHVMPNEYKLPPNRKSNCYIGAQLTAYARQVIFSHMRDLINWGATIYQVDCDSIIFTLPNNEPNPLKISEIVGQFKYEIKEPICSYYSLGPKNYSISYRTVDGIENISKS
jgi:G:T-mismatch repair DNA endonuclease (very short patch repair protein)